MAFVLVFGVGGGLVAFLALFWIEFYLRTCRPQSWRPSTGFAWAATVCRRLFHRLGVLFAYLTNATYFLWKWLLPRWRRILLALEAQLYRALHAAMRALERLRRWVQNLWQNLLQWLLDACAWLRAAVVRLLQCIPWLEIQQTAVDLILPLWDLLSSPVYFFVGYLEITTLIRAWWRPLLFPTAAAALGCLLAWQHSSSPENSLVTHAVTAYATWKQD